MKFKYNDEIYEDESDLWMELASSYSTSQGDETDKCDICGEVFEDFADLGMHIAWGHGKAKRIPETVDEKRMEKEFRKIPAGLSEEERYKRIVRIVFPEQE